jgi:hypothetical protein
MLFGGAWWMRSFSGNWKLETCQPGAGPPGAWEGGGPTRVRRAGGSGGEARRRGGAGGFPPSRASVGADANQGFARISAFRDGTARRQIVPPRCCRSGKKGAMAIVLRAAQKFYANSYANSAVDIFFGYC